MSYENKLGKMYFHIGFMRSFGLGINVSKYGLTVEFLCFYGGLEY